MRTTSIALGLIAMLCLAAAPASQPAPKRVVFLVDGSGTMIDSLIIAKFELVDALKAMPEDAEFGIVINSDGGKRTKAFKREVATPKDKQAAISFVEQMTATGVDGDFKMALSLIKPIQPSVVWFLTDGDIVKPDAVVPAMKAAAKRDGYRLNVLMVKEGEISEAVRELADATGGQCFEFDGKTPRLSPPRSSKPMADSPKAPRPTKPKLSNGETPKPAGESSPASKPTKPPTKSKMFWEL